METTTCRCDWADLGAAATRARTCPVHGGVNARGIGYRLERDGKRIALIQVYVSPRTGRRAMERLATYDDARVARRGALANQRQFEALMGYETGDVMVDETGLGVCA